VIKLNRGSLLIFFSISLGFTPFLVLVPIENKPYNLKWRKLNFVRGKKYDVELFT
jgi:hypothetical protein